MFEPLLVRACRLEPVERTPVWFMRQAGRSLPEYRELRKQFNLFEVCRRPELCAEVTLQPVRRHGVDAAVMFADIMLPVLGMGIDVELVESVGPVIAEPVRTAADVERLRLHFPGLPLREGRFFVDVVVGTDDGDAELAFAERALELSVFSSDSTGGGAIRLGGTWELPTGEHAGEG